MALGQGGKTLNDRKLAAEVRTLSLNEMRRVLQGTDEDYKKQLILKLAATVLPRINEHSGPDGGNIPIPIFGGMSANTLNNEDTKHDGDQKDIPDAQEDQGGIGGDQRV